MTTPLRVAAAQYAPPLGDRAAARAAAVDWTRRAIAAGARLIVLPELASSGYAFASDDEARALAESATGEFVEALTAVASGAGCHIVAGMNETAGSCRYNSAIVIGPAGPVATYRKLHLFHNEQSWFVPGGGLTVVDLPWGRLGVMICYDLWFPEVARTLTLAGADIIAVPTNWVSNFKNTVYDDRGFCQGDYVALATAAQNGVAMICADRIGEERGTRYLGASLIVGADGWPLAGPAPPEAETLLIADIDLGGVAAARRRTPRNHLLNDRRPAAYNVATGPAVAENGAPSPSTPSASST